MKKWVDILLLLVLCISFFYFSGFFGKTWASESDNSIGGTERDLTDKINIYGNIELDFRFADEMENGTVSDIDITTIELGTGLLLHEYVTGNIMLKGEDLGSSDTIFWNEVSITLRKEGFPFYFMGGKRLQPFGVFTKRLLNDSITQDLYEIYETGATFGFAPGIYGLDISITAYKGEELMAHMIDGAYQLDRTYQDDEAAFPAWRKGGMSMDYRESDDLASFILNITIAPAEDKLFSIFFDSEPGDGHRNDTLGGMLSYGIGKFILDMEYIVATQREKDSLSGDEYKESAWFGSVAYRLTDLLEIAGRYEGFDDGISGKQEDHLDYRYGLGGSYLLFENNDTAVFLMGEYRKSYFEKSSTDNNMDEFFLRLAMVFLMP